MNYYVPAAAAAEVDSCVTCELLLLQRMAESSRRVVTTGWFQQILGCVTPCHITQQPLVTQIVCDGQAARHAAAKKRRLEFSRETAHTLFCSCLWAALHVCSMASVGVCVKQHLFSMACKCVAHVLHMHSTYTLAAAACVVVCRRVLQNML
jgi:hypothetical protein